MCPVSPVETARGVTSHKTVNSSSAITIIQSINIAYQRISLPVNHTQMPIAATRHYAKNRHQSLRSDPPVAASLLHPAVQLTSSYVSPHNAVLYPCCTVKLLYLGCRWQHVTCQVHFSSPLSFLPPFSLWWPSLFLVSSCGLSKNGNTQIPLLITTNKINYNFITLRRYAATCFGQLLRGHPQVV